MKEIIDFIPQGRNQAISQTALAGLIGINERQLRRLIHRLRRDLYPIFTDPHGGFFRPSPGEAGVQEAKVFFRQMNSRGLSSLACARCAKAYLTENDQQMRIENLMDDL